MITQPLAQEVIQLSYTVADAWLERLLRQFGNNWIAQRTTLTSGSSRYELRASGLSVGIIECITIPDILIRIPETDKTQDVVMYEARTLIEAWVDTTKIPPQVYIEVQTFVEDLPRRINKLMHDPDAGGPMAWHNEAILYELERMERTVTQSRQRKPRRDAPIDTWLDYRDALQEVGRKISLKEIQNDSVHSIDALKKRSAERSRQKKESEESAE